MVVKPTDIVNWENEGKRLEEQIDGALKTRWKGKGMVKVDLPPNLPERIAKRLVAMYQKAGWVVSHNQGSCQRDGEWNFLEFREAK